MLVLCLVLAFACPRVLAGAFTYKIAFFRVYHVLWAAIALILIKRMIPSFNPLVSSGKMFRRNYSGSPLTPSGEEKLRAYTARMNRGAAKTAVYWTLVVLVTGVLFHLGALDPTGLMLVVVFFIFMDQFCVTVWCPFEWIIGNKCCNSCRINNWGYLMAFAPLVFLQSFWTWSLVGLSLLVVIQWEYQFFRHPERFFELCNRNLLCRDCTTICTGRKRKAADPGLHNG